MSENMLYIFEVMYNTIWQLTSKTVNVIQKTGKNGKNYPNPEFLIDTLTNELRNTSDPVEIAKIGAAAQIAAFAAVSSQDFAISSIQRMLEEQVSRVNNPADAAASKAALLAQAQERALRGQRSNRDEARDTARQDANAAWADQERTDMEAAEEF